jgi:hypothetical protein
MSCEQVQEHISLMPDQQLTMSEWEYAQAHIRSCRRCHAHLESMETLRARMRSMAAPQVPAALTAKLRVDASHAHARRVNRLNLAARFANCWTNLRLTFDNLMRPFAVPVTGGLFTAMLLFSFLMPSLMFLRQTNIVEPPIAIVTDPDGEIVGAGREIVRLEPGTATISGNETSLVLLIDERGCVQDYYLSGGELTDEMKSLILLSRFTPATIYGQPTWGLKQVVFQPTRRMRS